MKNTIFIEFYSFAPSVKVRLVANFLRKLCTQVVVPFMTIYLAAKYGNKFTGMITILILATGSLVNLYGGVLTERVAPNTILKFSEIAHLVCIMLMMWCLKNQLLLVISYFLKNIFFSLTVPSGEIILIDGSSLQNRKTVFTINNILNNLSIPAGILIGGFLYQYGINYLLLLAAIASIVVCFMYFQGLSTNTFVYSPKVKRSFNINIRKIIQNKSAIYILMATVFLFVIEFSFLQYFAVKISKQQSLTLFLNLHLTGVEAFSILRAESAFISIMLAILLIKFIAKFNSIYYMAVLILISTSSFISLLYCTSLNCMVFLVGIMSMVDTLINPALQNLYINSIGDEHKGVFLSLYSLNGRVANILSGFILTISTVISITDISIIILSFGLTSAMLMLVAFNLSREGCHNL